MKVVLFYGKLMNNFFIKILKWIFVHKFYPCIKYVK